MERRLQLLLDRERYDRLEAEARSTGRSVSAVIRQAIDVFFDADVTRRAAAAERFLSWPPDERPEPEWAVSKAAIEERAGLEDYS